MIEYPIAVVLVGAAAISGLLALTRRRSKSHDHTKRTEELIQKLHAAAREADEHIAQCVRNERTQRGRDGW